MQITVLSLKQPWAELIASGKKTIELRKWSTKFRGEFYVHASKNTDVDACRKLGLDPEKLVTGAIIAKCELVDIKKYSSRGELAEDNFRHYAADYDVPCYGFILGMATRINPVKCSGQLGFFKLSYTPKS